MGLCLNRPTAAVAHQDDSDSDLDEAEADYWLPPGSVYGSWRLREKPDLASEVIGVVSEGERFRAVPAEVGGWLAVRREPTCYARRRDRGERRLRLVACATPARLRPRVLEEDVAPPAPPASPETDGGADDDAAAPAPAAADDKDGAAVAALLQARKVAFEAATGATRVRLGFRLEATRRQLAGVAGFSEAQIDGCFEDGTAPGRPRACRETPAGFPRGFANARARTCWLSALAQALWHDPGFRAAFDAALATTETREATKPPPPRSPAAKVDALRRCWAAFRRDEGILKADALAEAFGDVADPASGYGDTSEAYCALRSALDVSDSPAMRECGAGLRYAPLMPSERAPSMENVWREVGPVFDLDGGTLVAFDLAWRPLDAPSVRALVLACGEAPDGYALSSLICYHHSTRHYVVFVRVDGSFLYFNDLHHDAAHQHLSLEAVSALCGDRFLQPRLALHGRAV